MCGDERNQLTILVWNRLPASEIGGVVLQSSSTEETDLRLVEVDLVFVRKGQSSLEAVRKDQAR